MKYTIATIIGSAVVWFLFWKLPVNGLHIKVGEGQQTGYISAVETTGLIWKTGRVYIKPTLESTQEDIYCVADKSLLETLKVKSQNKENVTVKHISWVSSGAKNCAGEQAVIISFN